MRILNDELIDSLIRIKVGISYLCVLHNILLLVCVNGHSLSLMTRVNETSTCSSVLLSVIGTCKLRHSTLVKVVKSFWDWKGE